MKMGHYRVIFSAYISWIYLCVEANADTKITINYSEVEHFVKPVDAIRVTDESISLTLGSDHTIKTHFIQGLSGQEQITDGVRRVGKRFDLSQLSGIPSRTVWHIRDGTLIDTFTTDSYTATLQIDTNGIDSCSATRIYQLHKGNYTFKLSQGRELSDVHAENISCTISSVTN